MEAALASLPLLELSRWILLGVPGILVSPQGPIFAAILLFIGLQYRRLAAMEAALLGRPRRSALQLTLSALLYGMAGGLVGSYLIVLLGVALARDDLAALWPLALALALVHPRFLCFSYAGGLLSLWSLVFGAPQVNVPGIVALVAVLHVVEGVLVLLSGDDAAFPVTVRRRAGDVVGGFVIQRFWPVPVTALLLTALPEPLRQGALPMPDWWPLIRPPHLPPGAELDVLMLPAAAALGYADVALTADPSQRARRSGLTLLAYSSALLVLAWAASRVAPLQWLAALAAPGLHEWMIQAGRRRELRGAPRFAAPARGVRLLEVVRGGVADQLGLRRGDVIVRVNGREVVSRADLRAALEQASWYLEVEVLRDGQPLRAEHRRFRHEPGALGVVTAPEPGEPPLVDLDAPGPLMALLRRVLARLRGDRG